MVSLKHKSTSKIELLQQVVKSYGFVEFIQVCSFSDIIQYLQRLIIINTLVILQKLQRSKNLKKSNRFSTTFAPLSHTPADVNIKTAN